MKRPKQLLPFLLSVLLVASVATKADSQPVHRGGSSIIRSGGTTITVDTVANLPASPLTNDLALVTDGSDESDCTTGTGTDINMCVYNGSAWVIIGDGTAAAASGDAVTVNGVAVDSTANFKDNLFVDYTLTDGGAGGPDDVTSAWNLDETLAGNPALNVDECVFFSSASGFGFICEGSTADANEYLGMFPNVNPADSTYHFLLTSSAIAPTAISAFLDEDAMGTDSATAIASQQSIKAYVDAITAADIIYDGTETIEQILDDTINAGVLDAITFTDEGGINISWTTGEIFEVVTKTVIDTDAQASTGCTDDSINYIYYDRSGGGTALTLSTTEPTYSDNDILVGEVVAQNGDIYEIHTVNILETRETDIDVAISDILVVVVTDGLLVSEDVDVTNAFDVEISAGTFYHFGTTRHVLAASFNTRTTAMTRWFHTGGNWDLDTNAQIDMTQWDDLTNLTGSITASKYYRSMFMYSENMIHWIYPQAEYSTIAQAIAAPNPVIPAVGEFFPRSVAVIMKGNDAAFPTAGGTRWLDIRPILGTSTAAIVTDHGNLAGLADDDHTQYLLVDGTRAMTGDLTLGGIVKDNDDMVFEVDADNDGSNKYSFTDGASAEIASLLESGLFSTLVGIDGIGAIDLDYGSADILDHTFIEDGGTYIMDNGFTATGEDLGSATAEWNDLFLNDGGVIQLGADQDVTITHVADTGIQMELDDKIMFGDTAVYIHSDDDGYMDVDADTGIRLNAATAVSGLVTANAHVYIKNGSTTSGFLRLYEDSDDGGNYTEIRGVATAADLEWILPATNGTAGQVLEIASVAANTLTLEWDADGGSGGGFSWQLEPKSAKLPSSNPMGIDAGNNQWRGLFDDTTDECARWQGILTPYTGPLKAELIYSLETTSTSDVVEMEIYIMCITGGDAADVDTDSFGSVDNLSSGSVSTTAGHPVKLSDASLNGDSCSEDDLIIVKVCRDADDTDTTADDVELRGVMIYE